MKDLLFLTGLTIVLLVSEAPAMVSARCDPGIAAPSPNEVVDSNQQHDAGEDSQAPDDNDSTASPSMHTYMIIYSPGPSWLPGKSVMEQPLMEHGAYMHKLFSEGRLRSGGPFMDDRGGAAVILAVDDAEAQSILENDPAVRDGIMNAVLHPWYMVDWEEYGDTED